eukprot:CAMPEP_0172427618 /NCGR_PEP_ID=MMETSP1064-20121228/42736_1 /TAXON_ID=202472 /ORGANISM="Aulacoseira subarctica , Strain CCAP 1002/5" /LENGTH=97 /DNA_ID=CAMNT_0013171905 /DNA_START=168 /DNA_END=461 /DNA_ORIENTATION=+
MRMDEKDMNGNNEASLNALESTISLDICTKDTAVSSTSATAEEGDDSGDPVEKNWPSLLQSPIDPFLSPSLPVGKSLHILLKTRARSRRNRSGKVAL